MRFTLLLSLSTNVDAAPSLGSLKRLVTHAEKALLALSERDALAAISGKERLPRGRFNLRSTSGLQHLDESQQEDGRVRARSEPPSPAPRHMEEYIPRTGSEGSSIRDGRDEQDTSLSWKASGIVRNKDRSSSLASTSSISTSSSSDPTTS